MATMTRKATRLFRNLILLVGMMMLFSTFTNGGNGRNIVVVVDALLPTPDLRTRFRTTTYQQHHQRYYWGGGRRRTQEPTITMGMQIKIRIVGRKNGSEKWLEDAYQMYETRLRPSNVQVDTLWHKTDTDLVKHVHADQEKGHTVVLLDPAQGQTKTSEQFSTDMYNWLDVGGSRLSFVIGGAPGLPTELLQTTSKHHKLSLSALTFTHQFARTLLVEQIYRATEIRKGSGYHK